jgi:phenylacetate-CoA ligase
MLSFLSTQENRSVDQRESDLSSVLPKQIQNAKSNTLGYREALKDINPGDIVSISDLQNIKVLRKSELMQLQKENAPFGGFYSLKSTPNFVFQSPGPIYDPGSSKNDWWNVSRFMNAVGIGPKDIVQNCFSYHLTPAGKMFESGALALGATVLPAGVGNTEQQASAASFLGVTSYAGTPEFLLTILNKADELKLDISSLKKAAVSGGPLFPQVRKEYTLRGIRCLQAYATADVGTIAYETIPDSPMIVDENVIVEIVIPGTGIPVNEGDVGEVVVTSLNPDYPLIRFATGDLSAIAPGISKCGRTNSRIVGWRGRADQATKVKGMFVRPEQVAILKERYPEIKKIRVSICVKDNKDSMTLKVETDKPLSSDFDMSVKDFLKLMATVEVVSLGTLPNDGLIIEDLRPSIVT